MQLANIQRLILFIRGSSFLNLILNVFCFGFVFYRHEQSVSNVSFCSGRAIKMKAVCISCSLKGFSYSHMKFCFCFYIFYHLSFTRPTFLIRSLYPSPFISCVPSFIYLTPVSLHRTYKCVGTCASTFQFVCQML